MIPVSRGSVDPKRILEKTKNVLSLLLGRELNRPGGHWFVRHGSRRRVLNRRHLDFLLEEYLPDHIGLCWSEGEAIP